MTTSIRFRYGLIPLVLAATPLGSTALAQPADLPIQPATTDQYPPGVKVTPGPQGAVYTDADGHVLYGMDTRILLRAGPDPAQYCQAACAAQWKPMLAPAGTKPNIAFPPGFREPGARGSANNAALPYKDPQKAPDWTVIAGPQGPQWVYKGWHLVFTHVGDAPGAVDHDGTENMVWNSLKFVPPVPKINAPQGVRVQFVDQAYALVDAKGHVLFSGTCAADCARWRPLEGGMAAAPIGDWRVSTTGDMPQWTYRGQPVFVSQEDSPLQTPPGAQVLHP